MYFCSNISGPWWPDGSDGSFILILLTFYGIVDTKRDLMFQGVTRWHQPVQAALSWWRHPLCQPCVIGPSQHCQPVPVSWLALVHTVWNLVLSSVLSIWVQPKINHSQSQQGSRYKFSSLATLSGLSVWSSERPVCTGMQCFQNIPDTRSWERERYYMTMRTLLLKKRIWNYKSSLPQVYNASTKHETMFLHFITFNFPWSYRGGVVSSQFRISAVFI